MEKERVSSPHDALAYLLDCQLATVETLAIKKKRPRGCAGEYGRQVRIAQINLDWCRLYNCDISGTRGADVVAQYFGDVEAWATQYHPK